MSWVISHAISAVKSETPHVVIYDYRWRLKLAPGEPRYDGLDAKLAAKPVITVPTIAIGSDFRVSMDSALMVHLRYQPPATGCGARSMPTPCNSARSAAVILDIYAISCATRPIAAPQAFAGDGCDQLFRCCAAYLSLPRTTAVDLFRAVPTSLLAPGSICWR